MGIHLNGKRALLRVATVTCAGLIGLAAVGCSYLDAAATELAKLLETESAVSTSVAPSAPQPTASAKSVRSGASVRGANLKELDAVGELVEEEGDAASGESTQTAAVQHAWDLSMMPYRAMLSGEEQAVYDEIYSNFSQRIDQFQFSGRITADRINDVTNAVYYDNPDFFWLDSSYRYSYNTQGQVLGLRVNFNETADRYDESKRKFDAAADKLIREAQKLSSAVEQEKYLHDRLLDMVEYDLNASNNQSAYSALVDGRSVCAGYARAFQYLMMKLGIPCYYCVGVAGEDHAWNIVALDGGFYNVDLAWNDPIDNPKGNYHYEYFNLTDDQIFYDHQRRELSRNLPACDAKGMGYAEVFGSVDGQPARKGGAPQSYRDLGFFDGDVLRSLDEYYDASYQVIINAGQGSSTGQLVLANERLLDQVRQSVQTQDWFSQYVIPAANELGLNGFSAEISLQTQELADGYYLLTQTIDLKGQSQESKNQADRPEEQEPATAERPRKSA